MIKNKDQKIKAIKKELGIDKEVLYRLYFIAKQIIEYHQQFNTEMDQEIVKENNELMILLEHLHKKYHNVSIREVNYEY